MAAAALAACAALAQDAEAPLRALRWLAPGADRLVALTREPTECLPAPPPAQALAVEIGRAAFRTPVVLGGQAARAGLSCESCHRAGRGNQDFHFPGLSGAPGTADVTSPLISSHRGNAIDDPRPIPDLSGPKSALKIPQAPGDPTLAQFVRGLIVEEFDGAEPPPAVLDGLTAYVRSLDPAACPARATRPTTPEALLDDARRAAAAAQALNQAGDTAAARVMVLAARARLGLIDERYAGQGLTGARTRLRRADAQLAICAEALRSGSPDAGARLAAWGATTPALRDELVRKAPASLFDPDSLSKSLERRLPR